ncbi:MAG: M28 family peptidase [Myxococcota bacterium]
MLIRLLPLVLLGACSTTVTPVADECLPLAGRVSAQRLEVDVRQLTREGPRRSPARRQATAAWLTAQLTDAGWSVQRRPYVVAGVAGENVVGRGTNARVLVGAHLDSAPQSPGADDNASGVAAVLELTRVLGPGVAVDVAFFDTEEPHSGTVGRDGRNFAYGSQALVDQGVAYDVVFVVESVGYTCRDVGCQRLPSGIPRTAATEKGDFIALVGNHGGARRWATAADGFRKALGSRYGVVPVTVPGTGRSIQQSRFSDHAPFWDVGVDALMITDTALLRNPHYHKASDTPDTLDLAFLVDVTRATVIVVADAARACGSGSTPTP